MGCQAFCLPRCCPDEQMLCLPRISENSNCTAIGSVGCNVVIRIMRAGYGRLACHQISSGTYPLHRKLLRAYSNPVGLVEQSSPESLEIEDEKTGSIHSTDEALSQPLSSDELKSLLMDTERSKLIKKLSEANQQNRFLKRQLQGNDNALVTFKSELAILEQEIQMLHALADEIVKAGIPEGTRKINGKYIHSHLLSRLEAVQKKLQDQLKDVDVAQSKEVLVFWIGMAESVEVMGSFDGWSQGEPLSPEYTGSYTKFSTTLLLRPGRYEIKFLVDGEWQISPEFPSVGEGLMRNNLLVVE